MTDQLELRPEGITATPSQPVRAAPRQAASSLAAPGEELTLPADREFAELWAENFRRRGIKCEAVQNGRKWVVVG